MLKRMGYHKDDVLEFNQKRNCGLWLIIVGGVISISVFFGGKFFINPFVFMIGYGVGFYLTNFNKAIRTKFSDGGVSIFQRRIAGIGIMCLFILMFILGGSFIPSMNWRMIWLGVLLATGLHFFIFYFVHGKSMLFLGLFCCLTAITGMVFSSIPFGYLGYSDAAIKVVFGAYLLFFSKPTSSQK